MGWQLTVVPQLQAGNTVINSSGVFVYSGTPAAGNLAYSIAPVSGTDPQGNNYLSGGTSYGTGIATQMDAGSITLYTGSLASGWTAKGQIFISAGGVIELIATLGVITSNNTLDNGSGGASFGALACTSLTVNGSGNTGNAGLPNGTINGTSGGASAGTAHTHGAGSFAVANGNHNHAL